MPSGADFDDLGRADDAAGARLVVDDAGLAPGLGEIGGQQAGHDVGGAAAGRPGMIMRTFWVGFQAARALGDFRRRRAAAGRAAAAPNARGRTGFWVNFSSLYSLFCYRWRSMAALANPPQFPYLFAVRPPQIAGLSRRFCPLSRVRAEEEYLEEAHFRLRLELRSPPVPWPPRPSLHDQALRRGSQPADGLA